VAKRKERDGSSVVEQGSFSIQPSIPPDLRDGESILATSLNAVPQIMLRLTVYTGKPVVSICSLNSKLWTRVTFSSWETLLSELYGAARELQRTEVLDLTVKIPPSANVQSWLASILHMFSVTQGYTPCSVKMYAGLLALSEGNSKSLPSRSSSSEPQKGSNS